jgi:hypothetical protein
MSNINDVLDLSKFDAKAISGGGGEYRVADAGEYLAEIIQEPVYTKSKNGNQMFKSIRSKTHNSPACVFSTILL